MASPSLSPLHRQLARVRRRLFWQTLVTSLLQCTAAALLLSAAWFLLQRLLLPASTDGLRWAVAGGLVGAGLLSASLLAFLRAPSKLAAALSLDERFGLKERVTTSLTLDAAQAQSPAGQALLADVDQRLARLDVDSRFPVHVSWPTALVPAGAAVLALAACFYNPPHTPATPSPQAEKPLTAAEARDVEQKVKELQNRAREPRPPDQPRSPELQKLDAEWENIVGKPRETRTQVRELVKDLTALEDLMKDREKELAARAQAIQDQLKQMEDMARKQGQKDGPAKDLENALAEGKLDQAKEEIERLAKKLQNNELSDKDKEHLEQQLQDLQEKLERLAQQKDREDQLQKLAKEGKLDPETLKRELDLLHQQNDKLKDLQDLANQLGQCQQCLKKGDGRGAAGSLQRAGDLLRDLDLQENELEEIQDKLQQLVDARDSLCKACDGPGDPYRDSAGGDNPVPGRGRRPEGQPRASGSYQAKEKVDVDRKGQVRIESYVPGQSYTPRPATELAGEIQQAAQEAPQAIEQQRIPRAAREMAKGYFRNLGGQKDPEAKKDTKPN
jgi:uncharacterized coiled-coil DUF342 family protein